MLNLKDTEFDDLFRRASDKYPLKRDSADWDRMAAALDKDPTPGQIDGMETGDRRKKRRVFWLLLFLPLAGVWYYALHRTGQTLPKPGVALVAGSGDQQNAGGKSQVSANPTAGNPQSAHAPASIAGRDQQSGATPGTTPPGTTTPATIALGTATPAIAPSATANPASAIPATATAGDRQPAGFSSRPAGGRQNLPGKQTSVSGRQNLPGKQTTASGGQQPIAVNLFADRSTDLPTRSGAGSNGSVAGSPKSFASGGDPLSLRWSGDMQLAHIPADYLLTVNVTAPAAVKNNEPPKQKAAKTNTHYFYAGILGAPDISTVHMQSVKGAGSTFGLLLGYAFNSRWSIETGAYLDQKKYYTDGEYFDTEKVRVPYNTTKILNVDGTCYMWEIPLNVRYIFNPAGKTKWFATAGLSTYLMSRENYTYAYQKTIAGVAWDSTSAWNIKRHTQYPFSIVNLSAGLEQRLGRVGNLRVEPYARLPLGGIGTGKLPIMSVGINIGFTRRLW